MQYLIKILILLNLLLLQNNDLFAQKKNKSSQKSKSSIKIADKYYHNFEFFLAAQEYAKVLESDPQNKYVNNQLAESYRHYFNYDKAEEFYKKTIDIDNMDEYPMAHYWYAVMLKLNGKYEQAKENLQKFIDDPKAVGDQMISYKEKAKVELEGCTLAMRKLKEPFKDYTFEHLPGPLNTSFSDYSPVIYENDSSVVIASSRQESKGNDEFGWLGGEFSDNYRFIKSESGWAQMHDKDIFSGLHTELNESPGSFSSDKKKFYFTRCDELVKIEGVSVHECAIYCTEQKDNKWQKPVKLNENINLKGQWNAQPYISPKGDTLFFVSKRPGGYGMHDIWMSTSSGKDDWGPAINLGPKINTSGIDMSPCYYAREKTLFFASNGHEGFGGLDIFIAKGNGFSAVTNAGLPFNSNRDDFYFTLGDKKGYLASNREQGHGNDDIYRFNIKGKECVIAVVNKDSLGDAKSISILGKLKYKDSNEPVPDLEILLKDGKGALLKKTLTDETGLFRLENLSPESYKVLLEDFDPRLTFEVKYLVENVQIKKSQQVSSRKLFENIYFDFDKYNLRPEARKVLDELVEYYKSNPEIQIEMNANTDAFGTDEYNVKLSKNRGKTSLAYLMAKGVKTSALVINAKGEDAPIATNNNQGGRQLNRRVEFYIVGGPGYEAKAMAYVIEPKATLYSVAKKYNMSVEELKQLNDLKNEKILAYRPLRVRRTNDDDIIAPATIEFVKTAKNVDGPGSENTTVNTNEKNKNKHENKNANSRNEKTGSVKNGTGDLTADRQHRTATGKEYYVVKPAETLFSIANMYGMTVDELKRLNKLKSNNLRVGQRLKVKKTPALVGDANTLYVVQHGDTIFSIAKQFGLTIEELKQLNNLQSDVLHENMVLKVKK